MSESSPLLRQEPDARRSLHDRVFQIFRSNSDSRLRQGFDSGNTGTLGLGITNSREPDARTRLLESYDRSVPVCGERRCSHGTFSPRPDSAERPTPIGASNGRFGYNGAGDAGAASSHVHGGDDASGSRSDSEYMSQMKSSFSMNEHKKQ